MKHLFAFLFSLLLITDILYTQPITWQRSFYESHHGNDEEAYCMCPADGQNIYVSGLTSDPRAGFIIKLNQYGDTIWTRYFPQEEFVYAIVPSGDGGCVFGGSGRYCIRLRSDGSVVWLKNLDSIAIQSMVAASDGNYVFCGNSGYTSFKSIVGKIDTSGTILWTKIINNSPDSYLNCIVRIANTGFISGGINNIGGLYYRTVYRLDENGNVLWFKTYNAIGYSNVNSIIAFNNFFLVTGFFSVGTQGKVFVHKLSLNGDSLSYNSFNSAQYYAYPTLLKANVNRVYLSFSIDTLFIGYMGIRVIQIDSNLTTLKSAILFPVDQYVTNRYLIFAPNSQFGEINICGTTEIYDISNEDFYVARIDSSLNVLPPPIEVKQISDIVPNHFELIGNFPNPFNPNTKIVFDVPKSSDVRITIFDVLGREVATLVNKKLATGKYGVDFDGSNLPSGVYFYSLTGNDYIQTKKMVLVK